MTELQRKRVKEIEVEIEELEDKEVELIIKYTSLKGTIDRINRKVSGLQGELYALNAGDMHE